MDTTTLVTGLIEEGGRIVESLPREGFEVSAALWMKRAEDGQWYFYIVSPAAESEPLNEAYSRLYTLIRRMPQPHWIDALEVRLIGPSHPIARDVLAILGRTPGQNVFPICWDGNILGNVDIERAYLYPAPAAVSG